MGRKKKSDLAEFQDWLVQVQYLADSTACVYASSVRSTLVLLDDLQDEAHVTQRFKEMGPHISRRALTSRKSAWNKFVAYAAAKGITLATPGTIPNHRGPPALPYHVRAALFFLSKVWKQKQLPALRWSMFQDDIPSATDIPFRDPFNPADIINIPREHVEALKEWSGFYPGEDRPLIPWKRNATIPYPAAQFRRELRLYRKDAGIETAPVSASGAAVDAAALAEAEALLAARQGVKVHGEYAPDPDFAPTRSTQDLVDLINGPEDRKTDGQREELPGEAGLSAGSKGAGEPLPHDPTSEHHLPDPIPGDLDHDPKTTPDLPTGPVCTICGYPEEVHAEAHDLTDGTISNCAAENGYPEDTCQMCDNGCYGRHSFKRKEMP